MPYNSAILTDAEIEAFLGLSSPSADVQAILTIAVQKTEAAIREFLRTDLGVNVYTELKPGQRYPNPRGRVEYPFLGQTSNSHFGSRFAIVLDQIPVHNDATLQVFYDPRGSAGQRTDSYPPESELVKGEDYFLDVDDADHNLSRSGRIFFRSGIGNFPRDVKVVYRAGEVNPTKLADLKVAYLIALKHQQGIETSERIDPATGKICNPAKGQILTSESLGGGEYSYNVFTGFITGFGKRGGGSIPEEALLILQKYRNYQYM